MKEIILGMLSVGMVSCYIASSAYCGLNLWFNRTVIDPLIKTAFELYFIATIAMIICGLDWIIHSDYMKIPTWQAFGWGVIHVTMPSGFFMINNWICRYSSAIKCDIIRDKILNEFKHPLHNAVGAV